ncbi:thioesterase family protein [Thalassiella azotivora]
MSADVTATAAYRFDAATAVEPVADGVWRADVAPTFSIAGRTNGGYLLATATRAALAQVERAGGPHLDPVAVSGAFVAVAPPGPVDVVTEVLRAGRGTSVVRVSVRSAGGDGAGPVATYLDGVVTCGALPGPESGHVHDAVPPVLLPDPADCVRLPTRGPGFEVPLMGELAEWLDPACLGWVRGAPSGQGELRGWVAFDDDRPVDALALVLAADCLPPATFDLGSAGWVPTMHLSVWLRAHPAPGALRVRQTARVVDDGSASAGRSATVDETCDVWDAAGRLVATGHQLAGLLLPR